MSTLALLNRMAEPPLLSIIIVNWNSAALLRRCLASLGGVGLPCEIIVVDNGSSDGSAAMVHAAFPQVRLMALPNNIGFARANNAALAEARGELLLLLNPDTEVRPGALEHLARFVVERSAVGIAGPTLWNPDGTVQPSLLPRPTLWGEFLLQTMLYRLLPSHARQNRDLMARPVVGVTGAALLIRRDCLAQIGPLDERIFMFYEDSDWCERARTAGWECWFAGGPGILHEKGSSSRLARSRTLRASQRSTIYFFRKHRGARSVWGLRVIALPASLLRLARAALLWLLGRERTDQAARLAAYAAILRWALTGREP